MKKEVKDEKTEEKSDNKRKSRTKSNSPKRTDDRRNRNIRDRRRTRSRSRSRSRDNRRRRSPLRRNTRSQSRDRFKRRRSISPLRNRRRNSRDRSYRRSPTYSPKRHRRWSPRRPRSPRTPDSPYRDRSWSPNRSKRPRSPISPRRSRSGSMSPFQKRRGGSWNRNNDYARPPSPQSDTESPVAGFKKSLADSTISDAELESQQQQYKIQTHMTTEGFYSYMDGEGTYGGPNENDSPRRLSLDERINIALGNPLEPPKYGYQPPEDYNYRFNYPNHVHQNQQPMHSSHPPHYQYDPRVNMSQSHPTGYSQIPNHVMPNHPISQHYAGPGGYSHPNMPHNRPFLPPSMHRVGMPPISQNVKPGVVQKGNVLEIIPGTVPAVMVDDFQALSRIEHKISPEQLSQIAPVPQVKQKLIFTAEEIQARKEKKLELKKKRKGERDKKRLEKKMKKEKLKLEIKRLVNMGVKDDDISSEEDAPFDDITRKGMYGTKDRGILKAESR